MRPSLFNFPFSRFWLFQCNRGSIWDINNPLLEDFKKVKISKINKPENVVCWLCLPKEWPLFHQKQLDDGDLKYQKMLLTFFSLDEFLLKINIYNNLYILITKRMRRFVFRFILSFRLIIIFIIIQRKRDRCRT